MQNSIENNISYPCQNTQLITMFAVDALGSIITTCNKNASTAHNHDVIDDVTSTEEPDNSEAVAVLQMLKVLEQVRRDIEKASRRVNLTHTMATVSFTSWSRWNHTFHTSVSCESLLLNSCD